MREEESSLSAYCLFRLLSKSKHNIILYCIQHYNVTANIIFSILQMSHFLYIFSYEMDTWRRSWYIAERCHQYWKQLSRNDELLFMLPEHSTATVRSSRQVHRQSSRRHRDSRLSRRPRKHDLPGFAAASTDGSPASVWDGQVMMNVL